MILMVLCLWALFYILLAGGLVWFVYRATPQRIWRGVAIAFFLLLPAWDVFLGDAVYHIACSFIPKVAIYETAETDGIYYEGLHDYRNSLERRDKDTEEELTKIGSLSNTFREGYTYAEARVVKERTTFFSVPISIEPVTYRCLPLPREEWRPQYQRTSCFVVGEAESKYVVKVRTYNIGTAEIGFKKVIDRGTGRLMAEYDRVKLWSYYGILGLPFFNWLKWGWGGRERDNCPPSSWWEYEQFEYQVLKPKR